MAVVVGLGVALLASGCSKNNAPCDTDPTQIDSARTELQSAEKAVDSAKAELAAAKQQKTKLQNQIDGLPDPADLESRLEVLKKGSGR